MAITGTFIVTGIFTWNPILFKYAIGSLIGVLISSDTDVDNGYDADKYIRKKFGKFFEEQVWDRIWYFYRRSFKHGGELSHFPGICTIVRIIYLYFLFIVIPEIILYFLFPGGVDLWYELEWWIKLIVNHKEVVFGLMYADFGHWILDSLTKEHIEKKKNKVFVVPPDDLMKREIWEKLYGSQKT